MTLPSDASDAPEPPASPDASAPLLRKRWSRSLVAIALVLASFGTLPLAGVVALTSGELWPFGVSLLLLGTMPLAVRVIELGRWSKSWQRRPEAAAFALVVGLGLAIGVYALVQGIAELAVRDSFGTPSGEIAFNFVVTALAFSGVVLLLASVPLPRRRAWQAVGGAAGATVAAALAAVAINVGPDGCGGFQPDAAQWRADLRQGGNDDTQAISAALVRCRTLDGATRAEVRALLGRPSKPGSTWTWNVGWVNDAIGLGDGQSMQVYFEDGRVREATLLDDEYGD